MDTLHSILVPPAKMVLSQVGLFVSNILLVFIIFIIGLLFSEFVVKKGITQLLKLIKLDEVSHRFELEAILSKGGINIGLAEIIGVVCYWISILVTLVVALNAVGLTIAADLMQKVVLFIPNIIAAVFILVVGMFAAAFVRNIVRVAANNAGISQAALVSNICEIVIMVFTVATALDQLQVGGKMIELTFAIILGSFGLGFAIALGLGCKDLVGKTVNDSLHKLKK